MIPDVLLLAFQLLSSPAWLGLEGLLLLPWLRSVDLPSLPDLLPSSHPSVPQGRTPPSALAPAAPQRRRIPSLSLWDAPEAAVAKPFPSLPSFKECIPRSFCRQLQENNFLTRFRLKSLFRKFLQRFQRHTVGTGKLTAPDIMYKYLSTLEQLAPRFGSELFPVLALDTSSEGEKVQPNGIHPEHPVLAKEPAVTHEVLITGTSGIQWRAVPVEVGASRCHPSPIPLLLPVCSRSLPVDPGLPLFPAVGIDPFPSFPLQNSETSSPRGYFGGKNRNKELEPKGSAPAERDDPKWSQFCDFQEVTHIVVQDCRVSIHRQDNKCLVSGARSMGRDGKHKDLVHGRKWEFLLKSWNGLGRS